MENYKIDFGKHAGKTFSEILIDEPNYLKYVFNIRDEEIHPKSTFFYLKKYVYKIAGDYAVEFEKMIKDFVIRENINSK
jgi:hypothetical protein